MFASPVRQWVRRLGQVRFDSPGQGAIANLFSLFADVVDWVFLNACYPATQTDAITQHIPAFQPCLPQRLLEAPGLFR